MKTQTKLDGLLDHKVALSAYLDDLLLSGEPDAIGVPVFVPGNASVTAPAFVSENKPLTLNESKVAESSVPEWAKEKFQALMFEVAGVTLAVPLILLKGVITAESEITAVPGTSSLQLGVVTYQGVQSKVVDTRQFIMPERVIEEASGDCENRSGHLVMIDSGRLALACDAIGKVVDLEQSDVKWRGASGKRAWLAGTVIEKMCALLDIDGLIDQLNEKMA